jgi:hypothetical protein
VEARLDSALKGPERSLQKATNTDRQELKRELERTQEQTS